jgi:acetoin utilization deacetylase AcuC-like enzyme
LKAFYSDRFDLALPQGHRFPASKYGKLRRRLIEDRILHADDLLPSPVATPQDVAVAHDPAYVSAIESGAISPSAMRRIGFPWSEHVVLRVRATMGGAVAAARRALEDGVSGQLAGGTHHAHYDFGAGYCLYNDFAIAALTLLAEQCVRRVAIVDLDVHQGDGNAAILAARPDVFVFSIHGEKNFPFRKARSSLDVALPDHVEDAAYLAALGEHLPAVFDFRPDIILYQAGVDPLKEDRLGRMNLTHRGLLMRDELIFAEARRRGVPVSIAIGGGYAEPIESSVEAYANTWRAARRYA